MDRKSIVILVFCFILFMAWAPLVNRLFPPLPAPKNIHTNQTAAASPAGTNGAATNASPVPVLTAATPIEVKPSSPEEILSVENENTRLLVTSHGGGIKSLELKHHLEAVGSDRKNNGANTNLASLNAKSRQPVFSILGDESLQGDGLFHLSTIPKGIRAEKKLTNGLVLAKEFRLSTNHLIETTVRMENQGKELLQLPPQEWVAGTASPMGPRDNNTAMLGVSCYHGDKMEQANDLWFANRTLGCLPGVPRTEFLSSTNVAWSAVYNQFFILAVIPQEPAIRMTARKIDLTPPSKEEIAADAKLLANPFGFQSALVYPGFRLTAGQALERRFLLYAGPKEYNTLARLGAQMKNNLDLVMDFGGFFGFFSKMLLLSMNGLNAIGLSYGLAIIAITIIIKLLFWPLTNASTRSMKRMSALQPQMKAIQEKYKDDPKKMNLKMMEFMKEHRISPMSGCFPILLQIPVFIGFYKMLQSAIELRGARFLWASDLSTADTIWIIPGLGFPVNPLPLVMGVTMLWQARLTPPSPGMDPMQQRIMKYMPLMFMVFLYNFSAGLTLYWTVQNLLSIAQMKLTKNTEETAVVAPRKSGQPTPGAFGARKSKPQRNA